MIRSADGLRAVATRLERERELARPVVNSLSANVDQAFDKVLPDSSRTLGFVDELTRSAAAVLEQDPARSRALAQFAIAVATALPSEEYPPIAVAKIEGQAWKELGTAHRYLSAYDASLRAYEAARRCFGAHGALAHDYAAVDLAAAVALSEAARFEEALALITKTAPVFAEAGDHRRLIHGALLRAMIHHRRGELDRARAGYEEALLRAKKYPDPHTIASIYNNLGQVCAELGDFSSAASSLTKAHESFTQLAMPAEVLRTEGALARMSMKQGDFPRAIGLLERVRRRFTELGLINEANFVALDLVDALVATDQRPAALELTERVVAECRAAGLNRRVILALSYLRDLLPRHAQPRVPVQHVRTYLEELRTDPDRAFVPAG